MKEYVSKASIYALILFISFVIFGCGGGGGGDPANGNPSNATLTSISVTPTNPSIAKGTSQQFTATGTYSDNSTRDLTTTVTWTSFSTSIATINSGGLGTAVAVGSTTVNASSGKVTGSTTLTVTDASLASIEITPVDPSIAKGTTKQFTATGVFSDSTTQDLTMQVTWSSSNSGVASIDNKGFAKSVNTGSASISAASGTISGSITLTVTAATLTSISVTPANPSIAKGTTRQFTATGTFSDSTTQDLTGQVVWSSSNTEAATISNGGLASALATGSTTITAMSGAVSGNTTLTVTAATLTSISVTPANPSIALGTTRQFTATGTYTDGSTQNLTASVTWSSSTGTATISNAGGSNGLATSVAVGTTIITGVDPATSVSGSTTLTVTAAELVSISVTPANASIPLGATQQFTATGTYTDNSTQDLTAAVTWGSSDTGTVTIQKALRSRTSGKGKKVAYLSNASTSKGLATAVADGTASITATDPSSGISGSTILTVAGTNVSGIINTNTTWALANSPYIITNDVQIAYGTTLTIEPGVVVTGNGNAIKVWGILYAVGNSALQIEFDNVNIKPGQNTNRNQPCLITIQFAKINGGSIYVPYGDSVGSLILRDSRVMNIPYPNICIYLWNPSADCYIERNIFTNSDGISVEIDAATNVNVYIRNNVFYQQNTQDPYRNFAVGVFENYGQIMVEYNSFLSTDRIALKITPGYSHSSMTAVNNYWNTTNTNVIDSMIYDKKDDLACYSHVGYLPILTSPHPNTPAFP